MPIKLGGVGTQENVTPAAAEGIKDSESWLPLTFFFLLLEAGDPRAKPSKQPRLSVQ